MTYAAYTTSEWSFDTVDQAPELPGVYAWYSRPDIGAADVADQHNSSADPAFTSLIRRHVAGHGRPDLAVTASLSFQQDWTGSISSAGVDEAVGNRSSFQRIAKREELRTSLADGITAAYPFLAAPLYIGKSASLRRRLMEHRRLIIDSATKDSSVLVEHPVTEEGANFARRFRCTELSPDSLIAWTLGFESNEESPMTTQDRNEIADALETILNACFRPLMGRK